MSPNETLFLEATNKIQKDDVSSSSFVQFSIWDFPGQVDFFDATFDTDMIFSGCGALIFVIDAQDDYLEALAKLNITVAKAYHVNPQIRLEVFIHKVDGLSDDTKMDTQRDIHQRATDDLTESGLEQHVHLSFYLTSIYDHSIFEAFSKVVQKLIPQLPTLENLLNVFISNSQIEKAFLFDVISKIYVATDSSPVDMQSYELCCDMIDVVIDVSCIYGLGEVVDTTAFDTQSSSIIRLNNSTILFLKEVNKVPAAPPYPPYTSCPSCSCPRPTPVPSPGASPSVHTKRRELCARRFDRLQLCLLQAGYRAGVRGSSDEEESRGSGVEFQQAGGSCCGVGEGGAGVGDRVAVLHSVKVYLGR